MSRKSRSVGPESGVQRPESSSERQTPEDAGLPTLDSGLVLWAITDWVGVLADGEEYRCQLRGTAKRAGRQDGLYPVVGDHVRFEVLRPGEGVITGVEPRQRTFSRRAAGPRGTWREQVLAANVDQVLVVFAVAEPAPHLRALDRFLVVAAYNELDAIVVANKIDLTGIEAARATFDVYERAGYPVWYTSARERTGIEGLREQIAGRVSLVAGPSGVGKSSLLNALVPGWSLKTGEISRSLNKGRHTTVVGTLYPLPEGGFVADTPGLREIGPWDLPPEDVDYCFREFRPFLGRCRYSDCLHRNEEGCAVLAALNDGAIDPARYESYLRLVEEGG